MTSHAHKILHPTRALAHDLVLRLSSALGRQTQEHGLVRGRKRRVVARGIYVVSEHEAIPPAVDPRFVRALRQRDVAEPGDEPGPSGIC